MKKLINLLPNRPEVCLVIKKAFSSSFCKKIIEEKKPTFQSAQTHYPTSYRNNDRQILDSENLSSTLFGVIQQYIPEQIETEGVGKDESGIWELRKLNTRIRICRYLSGQYFSKHLDGIHYESKTVQSKLTFMVYLNGHEEFKGGRTLFFYSKNEDELMETFLPDQGDLIIFDHNLWHSGEIVLEGEKYILRSDILYENVAISGISDDEPFSEGHLGYIWSIAKFRDKIVTGGRDKKIKIWQEDGQKCGELRAHKNSILGLLSLNENTLISTSRDQRIVFWDFIDGNFSQRKTIHIHDATVLSLCKLEEDLFASGGGDGLVNIVNAEGEVIQSWKAHEEWVWSICKIDDSIICTGSEDGRLRVWDFYKKELLFEWQLDTSPIQALAFDISKKMLHVGRANGYLQAFIFEQNNSQLEIIHEGKAHDGIIRCLRFDEDYLYSGGEDNKVKIWSLETAELVDEFEHDNFVQDILVREGSVISVSYDGRININRIPKLILKNH